MSFKVKNIETVYGDKIVHLEFDTQKNMCRTMVRFSEHYESPEFKGKVFTLKEFKKWYSKEHGGEYTYNEDWAGFNLPDRAFTPFLDGTFFPLTAAEWKVTQSLPVSLRCHQQHKYYVIATSKDDPDQKNSLKHELAHAMYYLNEFYHEMAFEIVDELSCKHKLLDKICQHGYHTSVARDEAQAFLSDGVTALRRLCRLQDFTTAEQRQEYREASEMINFYLKRVFSNIL